MISAVVAAHVRAPPARVRALYADPDGWARLFPATIRGARVVRRDGIALVVEVDHVEGTVLNVLHLVSPTAVELQESKRRYDATFVNEFLPEEDGTRLVVTAAVRLRWPYRLLAPVLGPLVRARLRRFVVEPLRAAAESEHRTGPAARTRR